MSTNFGGIFWGAPGNIIYLPLLIIALAFLVYRLHKVKKVAASLAAPAHASLIVRNFSWAKEVTKVVLTSCGLLCMFLALLRPQWDKKEQRIAQEGRDLFIALDISRSMLAQDCKPNRLACAKAKIKALVNQLASERVGLILFSGSSFVQCPLTADYAAFFMFLDHIDVETISSGSTALDQAVLQALQAFKSVPQRKNKLLAIFTDGEDFSNNLDTVKYQARASGLHIYTFGVGTAEGGPIPLFDERGKSQGHQKDKKGNVVISRLDERTLTALAQDSGGDYIRMQHDDGDVRALVGNVISYEKEKLEEKKVSSYEEQYPYFLAVAFACFALEWIL